MSTNTELANMFQTMATVLEISGANGFKVNANVKVARALEDLVEDVGTIDDITSIQGVGKSSAAKIKEYLETGAISSYNELLASIPPGLLDVMKVQGLGPKTVGKLWKEANVVDIASLQEAIQDGRLESLPRMGKKTIQNITESIAFLATSANRSRIGVAMPIAETLVSQLQQCDGVSNISFAGSLRRGKETIGDIDILASTSEPAVLIDAFCDDTKVEKILARGDTKCSVRIQAGMQIDLRIVDQNAFGAALLYFTGSKEHNIILRERAIAKGKKLNEYGLFDASSNSLLACSTEDEVYAALETPWIPPELREDRGELGCTATPALITSKDIKCDLHCHTTASDGHMSIQELAQQAIDRGFHTIAVTDHSQSQGQANGLKPDRLLKHIEAVHEVNEQMEGITILAGSEVDILPDGTLDYDDDLLSKLDIVVASPHAALSQSSEDATKRLLKAIEHPRVDIIGHPTGRIINKRKGLEPYLPTLIQAAKEHDTALELNANSYRLDLRDIQVRAACEGGARIAINTDAHRPEDFNQLKYGILTARRGWAMPENCINCLEHDKLHAWLRRNC
ncbi:MAG: DNA polymerase/3'-5' exonuclease PolX [Phycisphaerae bacterium]|jgi:DNA polymerase (family X)|nr:DNA polymerase/3'-5' exonuclease PolX [Phycisphaerae bacterium]MBT5409066.1 DNA polymerase/3'-5' exonuclease PolX [Phycisphaerae bacterium]MBT6164751.1 DNA polymerase/3'-5' exonuclease PolX [Phycisphaerae bacterium]